MLCSVAGSQGTGKAQPLTSNVLTPTGWVLMKDIQVGDVVCTPDGGVATVTGVYPQGMRDVYKIKCDDGAVCRADVDHLWKVNVPVYKRTKESGYRVTYSTKDVIMSTAELMNCVNKLSQSRTKKWGRAVRLQLTSPTAVVSSDQLPIPPYLLGCLVGDGSYTSSTPLLTSTDKEIIERCITLLRDGYELKLSPNSITYRLARVDNVANDTNEYTAELKKLGIHGQTSVNKSLPDVYLNAHADNRWELLQGLMDTDGTVSKRGNVISLTTKSHKLANQIQQLVWSLGGRASVREKASRYKSKGLVVECGTCYTVNMKFSDNSRVFGLSRKASRCHHYFEGHKDGRLQLQRRIVAVEPDGREETQCIMIDHPDHLYITDDYIVTHNTTLLSAIPFESIKRKTSRSILSDWNVTLSQVNNDRELTVRFQDEILSRKLSDERDAVNSSDVIFTERTYADLFVYALVAIGKDNEYSDWLDRYYQRCVEAQHTYSHVFYLTGGHFSPVHDGVRGINQHYSYMVDTMMQSYTSRMSPRFATVDTPSIEDRVNIITTTMKEFI